MARSAITQQTVVLNDFGLSERIRTTSKGTSSRFTITIKAQPIQVVFDAKQLGQAPAEAIADLLKQKVRGIGDTVTPATQAYRQRALTAFQRGEKWAQRRYGGLYIPPAAGTVSLGKASNRIEKRLGPMPPSPTSPSFWRDSGRFIAGIVARPTRDNTWVINVAANRFDPVTFHGGRDALLQQIARLQALVPEFGDARAIERDESVRKAIGQATDEILFGKLLAGRFNKQHALRQQLRSGQLAAFRGGLGALREIVTVLGG